MKNNFIGEMLVTLALIITAGLLINPMDFWMPQPVHMTALIVFLVLCTIFAGFVWYEKVLDEREVQLRNSAGRLSYLAGMGVLIAGVITQSFSHMLDGWLVTSLVVMIVTKVCAQVYFKIKN